MPLNTGCLFFGGPAQKKTPCVEWHGTPIFGDFMTPRWPQNGPKMAPRWPCGQAACAWCFERHGTEQHDLLIPLSPLSPYLLIPLSPYNKRRVTMMIQGGTDKLNQHGYRYVEPFIPLPLFIPLCIWPIIISYYHIIIIASMLWWSCDKMTRWQETISYHIISYHIIIAIIW